MIAAIKNDPDRWTYSPAEIDFAVSLAVETTMCEASRVSGMAVSTVRYFLIRAGHTPKKRGKRSRKPIQNAA